MHGVAQIENTQVEDLSAAERQQLSRERRRALGGAADFGEILMVTALGPNVVQQHVAVALDGGEQVVEVVRNATGQLTDRFDLLRLSILLFELVSLRDIEADTGGAHGESLLVVERLANRCDPMQRLVGPERPIGDVRFAAVSCRFFERRHDIAAIVRVHEIEKCVERATERPRRQTVQGFVRLRPACRPSPQIRLPHADARGLQREARTLFRLFERDFSAQLVDLELPFSDGPANRLAETRQSILQQIVRGTTVQRLHRGVFTDAAGDHDQRCDHTIAIEQLQRSSRAEGRHVEVAQDDIE